MMDKKSNVLIVEDHALTSFALKTSLSTLDFIDEIFEADNAQSAFDIIKQNKTDFLNIPTWKLSRSYPTVVSYNSDMAG